MSLLLIIACDSSDQPASQRAFTRDELLDPKNCKDCHPKHYAEWSSSMHAYASKDPVFLAMNRRGQEENKLGPFCVKCHAPMAVKENAISDYARIEELPERLQGITCYFCHNATQAGPDHFNGNIQLADDTTMRAAISRAQIPSVHKVQYSINHDNQRSESSTMCGTCHDIKTPPPLDFDLERTFYEYQQTFFSKSPGFQSCQTCHMDTRRGELAAEKSGYPNVSTTLRDVHEHLFPGVDLALTDFPGTAAMRSAVEECKLRDSVQYLTVDLIPPTARFTVRMETTAGHAQPSGATQDRRMWLEVVGTDDTGKVLYKAGQIDDGAVEQPPGTTHPCMMRDHTLDENGDEAHMFWKAKTRDTMRDQPIPLPLMPTAGSHTRECPFPAPGIDPIPHLELTLRMRPIGVDVLQDLVASGHLAPEFVGKMPTLTVWTRRADYDPTAHRYLIDNASPDCDKYKCLLDPTSRHCSVGPSSVAAGSAAPSAGAPASR